VFARPVATSSSVIHGFQHLVDDARFMAKARAERIALRRDDATRSVTMDMLSSTRSRTSWPRESIHVKPPVTMVGASRLYVLRPYLMSSQMPYKGHLRVPDYARLHGPRRRDGDPGPVTYPALHDLRVYPEPDAFLPERWLDAQGKRKYEVEQLARLRRGPSPMHRRAIRDEQHCARARQRDSAHGL
jgi:C-22 sterol desaturase